MKVFVINLPDSHKRRSLIEAQLLRTGLDYEIVPAVNGHCLTEDEIKSLCDYEAVLKHPEWLSKGAIGCALSHRKVQQQIAETGLNKAVIIEDDVILQKDFPLAVRQIEMTITDDEVVLLGWSSWIDQPFERATARELTASTLLAEAVPFNKLGGAIAYSLTAKVAERLSQANTPISLASDTWDCFAARKAFSRIRCVLPSIVSHANLPSDIGYGKSNLLKKAYRWVENHSAVIGRIAASKRARALSERSRYHLS